MSVSLNIYGQTYNAVNGIKAKDTNGTTRTFVLPESIPSGGTDTSDATLNSAGQLLSGVTAYAKGTKYTGTIPTKSQADLTVSASTVTTPAGYYTESASKSIDTATLNSPVTLSRTPRLTVDSETGLITASIPNSETSSLIVKTAGYINKDDRLAIKVSGSNTSQLTVQSATTVTPTESSQTAVAKGVYTTGDITVGAIPSTHVGSGVVRISSANVTVSGATVTAPIGYYSSAIAKTIQNGSATTPATTLSFAPAISVNASGLVTATVSGSSSITPTVTAGYVSAGTAGTVSVSGSKTYQLTTKAAATINTSTADQTVASGQYLTGAQTIKGVKVTGLTASNIASGVVVKVGDANDDDRIASVTGTLSFVTYYTGSTAPSSSLGNDGDIYLQT